MPSPNRFVGDGPKAMLSKQGRQSEGYLNIVAGKSQGEMGVILSPCHVKEIKESIGLLNFI